MAEQSGIVAGDGGYHIDVEGNVDLKAGLTISTALAENNSLEANSLTYSDLENVSKAKSTGFGLNLTIPVDGNGIPTGAPSTLSPVVQQPAKIEDSGKALSTISPCCMTQI